MNGSLVFPGMPGNEENVAIEAAGCIGLQVEIRSSSMQPFPAAETRRRIFVAIKIAFRASLLPRGYRNASSVNYQTKTLPRTHDDGTCLDGFAPTDDGERTDFAVGTTDLDQLGGSCWLGDSDFHRLGFFAHRTRGGPAIDRGWRRPLRRLIGAADFHGSLEHVVPGIDPKGRETTQAIRGGNTGGGNVARSRGLRSGLTGGEQHGGQKGDSLGDPKRATEHNIGPFRIRAGTRKHA